MHIEFLLEKTLYSWRWMNQAAIHIACGWPINIEDKQLCGCVHIAQISPVVMLECIQRLFTAQ